MTDSQVTWVISPIVPIVEEDEHGEYTYTAPKVRAHLDPATGRPYGVGVAARVDDTWALVLVRGWDFTPLVNDPDIRDLFGVRYRGDENIDPLDQSMWDLGWSQGHLNQVRGELSNMGVNVDGLTRDRTVREWLTRIGQYADVHFSPESVWTA